MNKDKVFKPMTHHRDEERYFFEHDQELIRAWREKANAKREKRAAAEQKQLHWMRCPKCGGEMEEIRMDILMIDRCGDCHGVYFDDGELAILRKFELEGKTGAADFLGKLIVEISTP